MISAAFFVMLTVAVLSANKMVIESNKDYIEAQAVEQGTNFANALISEILTKKFDQNISNRDNKIPPYTSIDEIKNWMKTTYGLDSTNYHNPSDFRSVMGPPFAISPWPDVAPYESIPTGSGKYNDVGDYNGYERTANSSDISGYHLKATIYYVSSSDANTPSAVQTYFKRIDVTVDHPIYLPKKLTFSAIATY